MPHVSSKRICVPKKKKKNLYNFEMVRYGGSLDAPRITNCVGWLNCPTGVRQHGLCSGHCFRIVWELTTEHRYLISGHL